MGAEKKKNNKRRRSIFAGGSVNCSRKLETENSKELPSCCGACFLACSLWSWNHSIGEWFLKVQTDHYKNNEYRNAQIQSFYLNSIITRDINLAINEAQACDYIHTAKHRNSGSSNKDASKGGKGGRNLCDPGDVDKIPIIEIDDLFFFLDWNLQIWPITLYKLCRGSCYGN